MMLTLGFVSLLLAAGPGTHGHDEGDVATMGSIYAVEVCRGRCSAEELRTLYRGHVVLLDGPLHLEDLRGRDGWTVTELAAGSNGCLAVRRYRDEASGAVLPEPVGFNAPVTWSRTEAEGLLVAFTTEGGERLSASLERSGPNWVGLLRSETAERDGDEIVIWQVGNGGTEYCVTLAK